MTKTEVLSALIHAAAKVGKSTLAATAPKPIIVLDAEGSWRFIKIPKRTWDPAAEEIPRWTEDTPWQACIVNVTKWETVPLVYQWLTQREHDFQSSVLDSITELQRRCKQNLVGDRKTEWSDWDDLLRKMDGVIRGYRDLTIMPGPVRCSLFVAETREEQGKWRPYMQGQIKVSLPYWVDICGYLYPDYEEDEHGARTKRVNKLWIGQHPQFETGERVQGVLGDSVTQPNIDEMIKKIFAEIEQTEVSK